MTRLILVRHAEAEGNIIRRFQGYTDSGLTDNGHLQAQKLADRLYNENIDILYSSDLTRTFQTARYIAKRKDLNIYLKEGLREINGGDWENVPWSELPSRWPEVYNNWENNPQLLEMPNGESMVKFQDRVVKTIKQIISANQDKDICAITHGTAIKVLLCYFYSKPLKYFKNIMWCDNASITAINIKNNKFTVSIENDNIHLGHLSTLAKQDWWKKDN